jgi:hypothetical protein
MSTSIEGVGLTASSTSLPLLLQRLLDYIETNKVVLERFLAENCEDFFRQDGRQEGKDGESFDNDNDGAGDDDDDGDGDGDGDDDSVESESEHTHKSHSIHSQYCDLFERVLIDFCEREKVEVESLLKQFYEAYDSHHLALSTPLASTEKEEEAKVDEVDSTHLIAITLASLEYSAFVGVMKGERKKLREARLMAEAMGF